MIINTKDKKLDAGKICIENKALITPYNSPTLTAYFAPLLYENKIIGTDCPNVILPPKGSLKTEIKLKTVHKDITKAISGIIFVFKIFI